MADHAANSRRVASTSVLDGRDGGMGLSGAPEQLSGAALAQFFARLHTSGPDEAALRKQATCIPATSRATRDGDQPCRVAELSEDDANAAERILLPLLRLRKIRASVFLDKLFAQPAWDMMLELLECHLRGRKISVSSLYLAAGVPPATALRRIHDMECAGLVRRISDPRDRRRQFVELTTETLIRLRLFLRHEQVLSALAVDDCEFNP